jgi:hypothetical protein
MPAAHDLADSIPPQGGLGHQPQQPLHGPRSQPFRPALLGLAAKPSSAGALAGRSRLQRGLDHGICQRTGAWANIPPSAIAKTRCPYLYRTRDLVERFLKKTKRYRRVATRYDKPPPIILPSSNLPASTYGCAFMSARPRARTTSALLGLQRTADHHEPYPTRRESCPAAPHQR